MSEPLDPKKLRKAIRVYREALASSRAAGDTSEGQLRHAFGQLLRAVAPLAGWELHEETPEPGKSLRFDGVLRKNFLRRGIWEAKDTADNLRAEIDKKRRKGYPLDNTLFEDTERAILFQNGKDVTPEPVPLDDENALADLLQRFFGHSSPQYELFDEAVVGFRDRVVRLSEDLRRLIGKAHAGNAAFQTAFAVFADLCRESINPALNAADIDNLLVQHLLIERLIAAIFVSDFFQKNAIAREIEGVVATLTGSGFDREAFYHDLGRFYEAIEGASKQLGTGAEAWTAKQTLLNGVYERFFQGYDPDVADTHGIVYTPQAIVDFMCASVEEVLKTEFGFSLGDPKVVILDPCTGTGNFVVNLLKRIPKEALKDAYAHRLFANEIQLLPYYIAALNIEHAYYDLMGKYEPFPGLCFVDTLDLVAHREAAFGFMTPENTERVKRQANAPITVIIGNPPYNVGQKNENDNNKNRVYRRKSKTELKGVDDRITETYAKSSQASSTSKLIDAYVRFFRWATDRLGLLDGVICFVTNNSFIDRTAFDGMRKHLLSDFHQIYHLDCRGNVQHNPTLSGTAYNVFGIKVGVGITVVSGQSKHSLVEWAWRDESPR